MKKLGILLALAMVAGSASANIILTDVNWATYTTSSGGTLDSINDMAGDPGTQLVITPDSTGGWSAHIGYMPFNETTGVFAGEVWEATFTTNDDYAIYVEQVVFLDGWGWNPGGNGTWLNPSDELTFTMTIPAYGVLDAAGLVIANDSSWTGRADGVALELDVVPEPATLGLVGLLGGGILWIRKRFMI